jgi:hypothetical protein
MPLSDEEIRALVARAEQLQRSSEPDGAETEALVRAAEDLGISRSAMEQALQERRASLLRPAVGDVVFAKSSDEKFYPAEVVGAGRHGYEVHYLRGGQSVVTADELLPPPTLPGARVTCPWPGWGAWTGTVLSYDAAAGTLTVSDGWAETATFPLRDVWLVPRTAERLRRRRVYAALLGVGAAIGAATGALVTALIM